MYGQSAGDQNLRTQEQESSLPAETKGWFDGGGAAEANYVLVIVCFHTVDALLYKMLRGTVTMTWRYLPFWRTYTFIDCRLQIRRLLGISF